MSAAKVVFWAAWVFYALLVIAGYVEILVGWAVLIAWAYEHEGLASGLLALAAALIGALLLQRQISQSERHEHSRRASKRVAVRTVLPLALSAITAYSVASGKAAAALVDQCVGQALPDSDVELPNVPAPPNDALATLKELVEFLEPGEVRPVALLIADIQVQSARLDGAIAHVAGGGRTVFRLNFEEYALDAGIVYARAASFFDFARGVTDGVPSGITWKDVTSALFLFKINTDAEEPIMKTILRRCDNDLTARVADRWSPSQ